ncbi:uncharacterized protein LOC131953099 [Physella acuta]|uniref:uncharacterized protein LOC131953099 n=1 Tax=Physella acuta TaxID=109671 RepID=UPI0027DC8423|nr:uncharacterized protein LOC131953099 [Physella acuta]
MAEKLNTFLAVFIITIITPIVFSGENVKNYVVCEENEVCELTHKWKNNQTVNTAIIWYKDNDVVSSCDTNGDCIIYPQYTDWIISDYHLNGNSCESTLKCVSHARQTDGASWRLEAKYLKNQTSLWSWKSTVYRKIDRYTCYIEVTDKMSLVLTCQVLMSYPESMCNFTDLLSKVPLNKTVVYNQIPVPGDTLHKTSYCSIPLSVPQSLSTYSFRVTFYPNLTDSSVKSQNVVGYNVKFQIEPPNVAFSCNTIFNEGDKIECSCRKSDASNLTTHVSWYSHYSLDSLVDGENEAVLEIKSQKNMTGFICIGSNALAWKSQEVFYNISIREKINPKTFRCPDPRQHICGRHGLCYFSHEYCTKNKEVESCFPSNIDTSNLLQWCRTTGLTNISAMRDIQCGHACVSRFSFDELYGKEHLETSDDQLHQDKLLIALLFITFGVTVIVVFTTFLIRKKIKRIITEIIPKKSSTKDHHCKTSALDLKTNRSISEISKDPDYINVTMRTIFDKECSKQNLSMDYDKDNCETVSMYTTASESADEML